MAEAANLSVSITGDASGLLSAIGTAQSALANLSASAAGLVGEFDGKEVKVSLVEHSYGTHVNQGFDASHTCSTNAKDKKFLCHKLLLLRFEEYGSEF